MRRRLALLAVLTACTRASVIGYVEPDAAFEADATATELDAGFLRVDDCVPSGVEIATVEALRAARVGEARWLYPYDQTVMPRGVGAPALMWEGFAADTVLVRVQGRGLDYETCWRTRTPQTAQLDEAAWTRIEDQSRGAPLTLHVAMFAEGKTTALPPRTLTIADGALGGSLYYLAYQPPLINSPVGAAILQLPLGGEARPAFAPISCGGCHSVSAQGQRMLTISNGLPVMLALDGGTPEQLPVIPPAGELTALTPDARFFVTPARKADVGTRLVGANLTGSDDAKLIETQTLATVADSGLPPGALMPSFGMEGDSLVFTDYALTAGRGVAMMRFDPGTRRFSDYGALFTSPRFPGWPTLLPGKSGVVFALGDRPDYGRAPVNVPGNLTDAAPSDLYSFTVGGSAPVLLHRAMGFASAEHAAAERSELPFPEQESHKSYNPQVARSKQAAFTGCSSTACATTATRACAGRSGAPRSTPTTPASATRRSTCAANGSSAAPSARSGRAAPSGPCAGAIGSRRHAQAPGAESFAAR